tara:strand:- start:897 stop:1580 length:684 start_codon:yes stop_codon:yes gene_type:complete
MISTEVSFDIVTSYVRVYPIGLPYFSDPPCHHKINLFSVNKQNFEKVMSLVNKYMDHLCCMEFHPLFRVDYPKNSNSDNDSYSDSDYDIGSVIRTNEVYQNKQVIDKNISIICKPMSFGKENEEDLLLLEKINPNVIPQINFPQHIFDPYWIKDNHFEKECQILESLIERLPSITLDKNDEEIHKIIKKTPIVEKSFLKLFSKEELDKVEEDDTEYIYDIFNTNFKE